MLFNYSLLLWGRRGAEEEQGGRGEQQTTKEGGMTRGQERGQDLRDREWPQQGAACSGSRLGCPSTAPTTSTQRRHSILPVARWGRYRAAFCNRTEGDEAQRDEIRVRQAGTCHLHRLHSYRPPPTCLSSHPPITA